MAKHTLQRLNSPARNISALIHLAGIASFSASFTYLRLFPSPFSTSFGGEFQFLTIIGLALAQTTFVIGLVSDLTLDARLFAIKNVLSVCSAPLEVLVSILYWSLCAIDRELVVPPGHELPLLPDLGFHAMPAIMLALDLLLLSPPWTIKGYGAMIISLSLAFLYWGWVEYCFSHNNWYPYPLFELLSTVQRVLLFTFSACLMTTSTMGLKWLYGKLNGVEELKKNAFNPVKLE